MQRIPDFELLVLAGLRIIIRILKIMLALQLQERTGAKFDPSGLTEVLEITVIDKIYAERVLIYTKTE